MESQNRQGPPKSAYYFLPYSAFQALTLIVHIPHFSPVRNCASLALSKVSVSQTGARLHHEQTLLRSAMSCGKQRAKHVAYLTKPSVDTPEPQRKYTIKCLTMLSELLHIELHTIATLCSKSALHVRLYGIGKNDKVLAGSPLDLFRRAPGRFQGCMTSFSPDLATGGSFVQAHFVNDADLPSSKEWPSPGFIRFHISA
jgi:hypothetical protein